VSESLITRKNNILLFIQPTSSCETNPKNANVNLSFIANTANFCPPRLLLHCVDCGLRRTHAVGLKHREYKCWRCKTVITLYTVFRKSATICNNKNFSSEIFNYAPFPWRLVCKHWLVLCILLGVCDYIKKNLSQSINRWQYRLLNIRDLLLWLHTNRRYSNTCHHGTIWYRNKIILNKI
jgi:phage FluMu protein Com